MARRVSKNKGEVHPKPAKKKQKRVASEGNATSDGSTDASTDCSVAKQNETEKETTGSTSSTTSSSTGEHAGTAGGTGGVEGEMSKPVDYVDMNVGGRGTDSWSSMETGSKGKWGSIALNCVARKRVHLIFLNFSCNRQSTWRRETGWRRCLRRVGSWPIKRDGSWYYVML